MVVQLLVCALSPTPDREKFKGKSPALLMFVFLGSCTVPGPQEMMVELTPLTLGKVLTVLKSQSPPPPL